MNHQISPWTIYDKQVVIKTVQNKKQKTNQYNRHLNQFSQDFKIFAKPLSIQQEKLQCSKKKIEQSLNILLALKIVKSSLEIHDKKRPYLPKIRPSTQINTFQLKRLKSSKNNKSRLSDYSSIGNGKDQQSRLNIVNYEPFNYAEIMRRGLIQAMKIRQRSHKVQSRNQNKTHQQ